MKTVGETLKSVREKQGKTLEEIAELTSINPEFLHSIELGEFTQLPSPVVVQGFISTYAQVLGIEPKTILALLRRDFDVTRVQILPKHLQETKTRHVRRQGDRRYLMLVVGACLAIFFLVGFFGLVQIRKAPTLTITAPKDGAVVAAQLTIRGVTASDAQLQIDAQPVSLNQDGEFAQTEVLSVGDHTLTVVARNRAGQETIKQIIVHVQE